MWGAAGMLSWHRDCSSEHGGLQSLPHTPMCPEGRRWLGEGCALPAVLHEAAWAHRRIHTPRCTAPGGALDLPPARLCCCAPQLQVPCSPSQRAHSATLEPTPVQTASCRHAELSCVGPHPHLEQDGACSSHQAGAGWVWAQKPQICHSEGNLHQPPAPRAAPLPPRLGSGCPRYAPGAARGHSPQVAVVPVRGPAGIGVTGASTAWEEETRARGGLTAGPGRDKGATDTRSSALRGLLREPCAARGGRRGSPSLPSRPRCPRGEVGDAVPQTRPERHPAPFCPTQSGSGGPTSSCGCALCRRPDARIASRSRAPLRRRPGGVPPHLALSGTGPGCPGSTPRSRGSSRRRCGCRRGRSSRWCRGRARCSRRRARGSRRPRVGSRTRRHRTRRARTNPGTTPGASVPGRPNPPPPAARAAPRARARCWPCPRSRSRCMGWRRVRGDPELPGVASCRARGALRGEL